jgi:hypothetical protein
VLPAQAPLAEPEQGDLSPFVAGPPISHPSLFFGRERELRRIFGLLRSAPLQNAAIIGPRRSGKTSLLHHLHALTRAQPAGLRPGQRVDWLPQPERYRWAYVDFQDPRLSTRAGLLRSLLTQLRLPLPAVCDLDHFMDVVGGQLRSPAVVLLDEMDVGLQRQEELDDMFWEGMRSLATTQTRGQLAFVLATRGQPHLIAGQAGLGSPFFNIFGYTADLGPLTEDEARELITSAPVPFPEADVEWILAQSGRWPFLLQILCRERLAALEDGEADDRWRDDGLRQLTPFTYLRETT